MDRVPRGRSHVAIPPSIVPNVLLGAFAPSLWPLACAGGRSRPLAGDCVAFALMAVPSMHLMDPSSKRVVVRCVMPS